MNPELQTLSDKVSQLAQAAVRLSDENRLLRDELGALKQAHAELEQRVALSRARVESALARLPLIAPREGE